MTGPAPGAWLEELVAGLASWSPGPDEREAARLRAGDAACAVHLGRLLPEWGPASRAWGRLLGRGPDGCGQAAMAASCCRLTEIDDIDLRTCTTPGSVVVPSALALVGESPDPGTILAAIGVGYEVVTQAAAALGGAFAAAAGTWTTRAAAALGAAATAARVLGLSPEATVEACAMAAGGSSRGVFPEPARSFSLGMAVAQGVAAAAAAAEGLHGDRRMLAQWSSAYARPSPEHLAKVVTAPKSGGAAPPVTAAVGRSRLKPYAAARQVLAGSATLRGLVETGELDPADVVGIVLAVPPLHAAMVDRPDLGRRLDTLASAQYQLASALDAPDGLDQLDHPLPPGDGLRRRMTAVSVVADPELGRLFPEQWGARLLIERRGGRQEHAAGQVPGEAAFGWDDLERKARRVAAANRVDGDELAGLLAAARRDDWCLLAGTLRALLAGPPMAERSTAGAPIAGWPEGGNR